MGGELNTYMLLPHITKTQQQILLLLYRFRFLNRIQLQTLLHNPDIKNINTWLKNLYDKDYIGRIVNTDSKVNVIPTIYYIGLNGIRYLKTRKECEKTYIKKLYKEKGKSKQFIDRCLLIANVYLKKYSSSDFAFYTQSDFKQNAVIRDILPDFAFKKKDEGRFTVVEMSKENMPRYAIRSRIQNFLTFFTEGEWTTNEKTPFIIFICPNETMKKYIQRYTRSVMEEMDIEVDFNVIAGQELENLEFKENEAIND